jgi:hypothetical protein
VAAAHGGNAIHPREAGLGGTGVIPRSEVVVTREGSGLLDGREEDTPESVQGSSSQDLGRVLPLIALINLPGRVGLAGGGNIDPRDAIEVRKLGPLTRYDVLGIHRRERTL